MHLIRMIYASKISSRFTGEEDIESILANSRDNNQVINISGILCYSNDYFLQCLEGSRINVNQLYHKILLDDRHYDPAILKYDEIVERDFAEWGMAYLPPSKITGTLVSKYSGDRKFNPYSMSGDSCYAMLKEMALFNIVKQ